jgi:RNA polymerase sigma-70 factor (ECF subfamily)
MARPQPPLTRLTLIGALCQGLRWEEFVALYGQLILCWGRRDFGLQESDAENLCQEVLVRVWKNIAQFDPSKGRFRQWLYACTRNAVRTLWRHRRQGAVVCDIPALEEHLQTQPAPGPEQDLPHNGDLSDALKILDEEEFAQESLREAVWRVRSRVQPDTWTAFLLFEFFDLTAKEIAPRLGLKPAAVNQAVYRVRRLFQQALERHVPSGQEGFRP